MSRRRPGSLYPACYPKANGRPASQPGNGLPSQVDTARVWKKPAPKTGTTVQRTAQIVEHLIRPWTIRVPSNCCAFPLRRRKA
ncbi:hypothetical protein PCLA_06r0217 [Pseudomonas citronellolis]|nr:hypothetical protein PCLA_06r0217 [Pseudomonas citronellolis]